MTFHSLPTYGLGEGRLSRNRQRCHWRLRRPSLPAPTLAVWEESQHPCLLSRPTRPRSARRSRM